MTTVHSIAASDIVANTRSVLTTNFQNLNDGKIETSVIQRVYKSQSQSVLNSVLTADDHLFFTMGANESWNMRLLMAYDSNTVPDIKYTFLAPAGTIGYFVADDAPQAANSPSVITVIVVPNANDQLGGINGIFINNSVAGNVSFYWAQNTDSSQSSVLTMYAGSNIIATRIN